MLVFNLFMLLFLVPYGYSTPLEPGQEGGPWTEEEIDIVREKVHPFHFKSVLRIKNYCFITYQIVKMMDCEFEARNLDVKNQNHKNCWAVSGLPDNLNEGDLDLYSRDHDEFNLPRDHLKRWKWRYGPSSNRLIELAFHDCLKYEDGSGGCDGCLNWKGVGYMSVKNHKKVFQFEVQHSLFL